MDRSTVTQTSYEVNGRKYTRLEDVPQPHRDMITKMLEDKNHDGVPDIVQHGEDSRTGVKVVATHTSTDIRDLNTGRQMTEDELVRKLADTDRETGITIKLSANALLLIIAALIIVAAIFAFFLFK